MASLPPIFLLNPIENDAINSVVTINVDESLAGLRLPDKQELVVHRHRKLELDGDSGHTGETEVYCEDSPAVAAIRGQQLTLPSEPKQRQQEPSEITDHGNRKSQVVSSSSWKPVALTRASSSAITWDASDSELQSRLYDAIFRTLHAGFFFLPNGQLPSLIHKDTVEMELKYIERSIRRRLQLWRRARHSEQTIRAEATTICGGTNPINGNSHRETRSYRKIFAILLLIEHPLKIRRFIEERVCDSDLPFQMIRLGKRRTPFELRRMTSSGQPDQSNQSLKCFQGWNSGKLERFYKYQWHVLAPSFASGEKKLVKFHSDLILPYTSMRSAGLRGGFGEVFIVDIHPDHHNFDMSEAYKGGFAVKRLDTDDKREFKREVDIMKKISPHPHLVSLLGTYEHRERFHLVFHRAQTDLRGYWKDINPQPSNDPATSRWLARQCQGIVGGLAMIHPLTRPSQTIVAGSETTVDDEEMGSTNNSVCSVITYSRHGDIKPKNLLWYPDAIDEDRKGIFRISDFGMAEYSTTSGTSTRRSGVPAGTLTYQPPECAIPHSVINGSCDIWSLGCVYLELIAWYFGGWNLVSEFSHKRLERGFEVPLDMDSFFLLERCKETQEISAKVKVSVTKFMQELREHPRCNDYFKEFLDMIKDKMLVIGRACYEEEFHNHGRWTSEQIYRELSAMYVKYKDIM